MALRRVKVRSAGEGFFLSYRRHCKRPLERGWQDWMDCLQAKVAAMTLRSGLRAGGIRYNIDNSIAW